MKVQLTRAARILHDAGEIVEVSPAEAGFLFSTGSAVAVTETPVKEVPEQCVQVSAEMPEAEPETPEGNSAASAETPEKAAAKKPTKKKSTK